MAGGAQIKQYSTDHFQEVITHMLACIGGGLHRQGDQAGLILPFEDISLLRGCHAVTRIASLLVGEGIQKKIVQENKSFVLSSATPEVLPRNKF